MSAKSAPPNRRSPGFLSEVVKRFVITQCARWERPTAIARMVKEQFGVNMSPQATEGYDPTKRLGRNLSMPHRKLFNAERERFTHEIDAIPIANAAYRIAKLQQYSERAEDEGDLKLAAQMLEQAARDLGELFTNRVNVTGTAAQPTDDLKDLTDDELENLQALLQRTDLSPSPSFLATVPPISVTAAEATSK